MVPFFSRTSDAGRATARCHFDVLATCIDVLVAFGNILLTFWQPGEGANEGTAKGTSSKWTSVWPSPQKYENSIYICRCIWFFIINIFRIGSTLAQKIIKLHLPHIIIVNPNLQLPRRRVSFENADPEERKNARGIARVPSGCTNEVVSTLIRQ